jgi:RHS repeat-associated protein
MELDNEVSGTGNSYTTEFRQYDPRLGRWKSLDPLMMMFPHMSPYVGFDNNPVYYIDPYGLSATNNGVGEGEPEGKTLELENVDIVVKRKYKETNPQNNTEFDKKLPSSGIGIGSSINVRYTYGGRDAKDGEITHDHYSYKGDGNWTKTRYRKNLNKDRKTVSGNAGISGLAAVDAYMTPDDTRTGEHVSGGGTSVNGSRGSGVSSGSSSDEDNITTPSVELMGDHVDNLPLKKPSTIDPDILPGVTLATTLIDGALPPTDYLTNGKLASKYVKYLKFVKGGSGVLGAVTNGADVVNDIAQGTADNHTAANAGQAALYTTGTVLLMTPLAPVGAIILGVTAAVDLVQAIFWGR